MSTDVHADPDPETTADVVERGVRRGDTVVVLATCEVDYDGRASGYLGPGDRVVICKPDGTLLVHRPTGNDPVNWQPPGSTIRTAVDAEGCTISARRSGPDEVVRVHLLETHQVTRYPADDAAPLELSGTEVDMHEHIMAHPDEIEPGLRAIEHERETPYGTIDVYGTDAEGRPVVVEVKRRQASLTHVDQLKRYMEQYRASNPDARGILVAPTASDRVRRALDDDDLEFVALEAFASGRGDVATTTFEDFC